MKASQMDLKKVVEGIGEVLKDAGQYVEAGKELIDMGQPVFVDATKKLVSTYADVLEELEPELAAASAVYANATHRDYANYMKAGFTSEQAFALVLAAVRPINFSEALTSVSKSLPKER